MLTIGKFLYQLTQRWWGRVIICFGIPLGLPLVVGIFTHPEIPALIRLEFALVMFFLGAFCMWTSSILFPTEIRNNHS